MCFIQMTKINTFQANDTSTSPEESQNSQNSKPEGQMEGQMEGKRDLRSSDLRSSDLRSRVNIGLAPSIEDARDADGKVAVDDIPVIFKAHVLLEELRELGKKRKQFLRERLQPGAGTGSAL